MKDDMDKLILNELAGRVIWEESSSGEKKSILDVLIQPSNLEVTDLYKINYVKTNSAGVKITGSSILQQSASRPQWRLKKPFPGGGKRAKTSDKGRGESNSSGDIVTDMDRDAELMMETDGSQYTEEENKRKHSTKTPKTTEEKNWECLLKNISYAMFAMVKESPPRLPFRHKDLPKPRYWSSEFSTVPIEDKTDLRKPDLVLLDFRMKSFAAKSWSHVLTAIEITASKLVPQGCVKTPVYLGVATKGYLILQEQPWRRFVLLFSVANFELRAHYLDRSGMIISRPFSIHSEAVRFVDVLNTVTLSNLSSLGFDPTIHMCIESCPRDGLLSCVNKMPPGAKGWVMDNEMEVYWIMDTMWQSHGLFSRGTVCYRVQDKKGVVYALKDCWVDAEKINHESDLLKTVSDIPNVVRLVKFWNVQYDKRDDETAWIRHQVYDDLPNTVVFNNKIHRRMLLTPCGLPLTTSFQNIPELVSALYDLVNAHEAMITKKNVLHGDLSPNNLIIHEGKGYFIDFDHAKLIEDSGATSTHGTGTVPYMSSRLLTLIGGDPRQNSIIEYKASDDLESLFYIFLETTMIYGGPGGKQEMRGKVPHSYNQWQAAYNEMSNGIGVCGCVKNSFLTARSEDTDLYTVAEYFTACGPILRDWRAAIGAAIQGNYDISHKVIREIIRKHLEKIENSQPHTPPSIAFSPESTATPSTIVTDRWTNPSFHAGEPY